MAGPVTGTPPTTFHREPAGLPSAQEDATCSWTVLTPCGGTKSLQYDARIQGLPNTMGATPLVFSGSSNPGFILVMGPMGNWVFDGEGEGVNRAPQNWGVWKRAQMTGPFTSYYEIWRQGPFEP